jgi:hypothetical protein
MFWDRRISIAAGCILYFLLSKCAFPELQRSGTWRIPLWSLEDSRSMEDGAGDSTGRKVKAPCYGERILKNQTLAKKSNRQYEEYRSEGMDDAENVSIV